MTRTPGAIRVTHSDQSENANDMLERAAAAAKRIVAQSAADAADLGRSGPAYTAAAALQRSAANAGRGLAIELERLTQPASARDHLPGQQ
jgi:hypothetical protein